MEDLKKTLTKYARKQYKKGNYLLANSLISDALCHPHYNKIDSFYKYISKHLAIPFTIAIIFMPLLININPEKYIVLLGVAFFLNFQNIHKWMYRLNLGYLSRRKKR